MENHLSFEKHKAPYFDHFEAKKSEIDPINAYIWA
jgi:hypothetical protein